LARIQTKQFTWYETNFSTLTIVWKQAHNKKNATYLQETGIYLCLGLLTFYIPMWLLTMTTKKKTCNKSEVRLVERHPHHGTLNKILLGPENRGKLEGYVAHMER